MLIRATILLAFAASLAGCATNDSGPAGEISISEFEVLADSYRSRDIVCNSDARIAITATPGTDGWFSVQVKEGSGVTIFSPDQPYSGTASVSEDQSLPGAPGLWTLRADKSLGYDGTFTARLTCS